MNTKLLLPNSLKVIGWVLFIPFLLTGMLYLFGGGTSWLDWLRPLFESSMVEELLGTGLIISMVLLGFTRLKTEDEYTLTIRLESFQLAFYVYASILLIAFLGIYGDTFFDFMTVSLFLPLLLYIVIFHIRIIRFFKDSNAS